MFAFLPKKETIFRTIISLAVLLNLTMPITALAESATQSSEESKIVGERLESKAVLTSPIGEHAGKNEAGSQLQTSPYLTIYSYNRRSDPIGITVEDVNCIELESIGAIQCDFYLAVQSPNPWAPGRNSWSLRWNVVGGNISQYYTYASAHAHGSYWYDGPYIGAYPSFSPYNPFAHGSASIWRNSYWKW